MTTQIQQVDADIAETLQSAEQHPRSQHNVRGIHVVYFDGAFHVGRPWVGRAHHLRWPRKFKTVAGATRYIKQRLETA